MFRSLNLWIMAVSVSNDEMHHTLPHLLLQSSNYLVIVAQEANFTWNFWSTFNSLRLQMRLMTSCQEENYLKGAFDKVTSFLGFIFWIEHFINIINYNIKDDDR